METAVLQTQFKKVAFPGTGISMEVPTVWAEDTEKKLQVLLGPNDQVLYSAQDKAAACGMIVGMQTSVNAEHTLKEIFGSQRTALIQLTAGYKEFGIAQKEQNHHSWMCLIYESNGLYHQVFNVLFMTLHQNMLFYGSIYGNFEDRQQVNDTALAIIQSIEFEA